MCIPGLMGQAGCVSQNVMGQAVGWCVSQNAIGRPVHIILESSLSVGLLCEKPEYLTLKI